MITLLVSIWASVAWIDPVVESVYVHEWGVVEVDEECLDLRGLPDGIVYDFDYQPDVDVKAPVIWFHGFPCTGTLSVELYDGSFTNLVPRPELLVRPAGPGLPGTDVITAVWEDLTISSEPVDTMLEGCALPLVRGLSNPQNFLNAIPLWRSVPCNSVHYPAADYSDAFIYYESDLHNALMFAGDCYGHEGEALLFAFRDWEFICVAVDVPSDMDMDGERFSDGEIETFINSWCPGLLPEEVSALWNTWKPTITYRCMFEGETLLLFPLTSEQTESISSIRFEPHSSFIGAQYHRLFLGLGNLRL
jgi:hypothetical protein